MKIFGKISYSTRSFFIFYLFVILVCFISAASAETLRFKQMLPVQKQPWYFFNPYSIAIDTQGYVYVADTEKHRIQKFTTDGQFVSNWGIEGQGQGEFRFPTDIAVDNFGFIYVSDRDNNRIQKFNTDGTFNSSWGSQGSGNGEFDRPISVAVSFEGYIYVVDSNNNRIQKFSSDGTFLSKWGTQGTGDGQFSSAVDIVIDRDGYVYVTDIFTHRIQKFTPEGEYITWSLNTTAPRCMAIDNEGFIYVTEMTKNRILRFSPDGELLSQWGKKGTKDNEFTDPLGITFSKSGLVYVVDKGNHRIQIFSPEGIFMHKWGTGAENGEFNYPRGIALDSSNNIYVADTYNHRIQKFQPDGKFNIKWGSPGNKDGEFNTPKDIAVFRSTSGDDAGTEYILVSDTFNHRIQKFKTDGTFVKKWGSVGTDEGLFFLPRGIASDDSGNIYVADKMNNRIQKFDSDGIFLMQWGKEGLSEGEFIKPQGIAVASDNEGIVCVYVADTFNHRIQKFSTDGEIKDVWEISDPESLLTGITADADGNLIVTDMKNSRILFFSPSGELLNTYGQPGSSPGQLSWPRGIATGADENLYVADSENHRIQIFERTDEPANNKAIIVAGGGFYTANYLWDATRMSTNFAYRTLTYQGFTKEDIYYLTEDTQLDLDNNGIADDTDGEPTAESLNNAITQWAKDADNLILYLTDHGGDKSFRLNKKETILASELDSWLDQVQNLIPGKVTVIYDACESGSFLSELTPPPGKERIVIGSTSLEENAYFIFNGSISFSNYFWTDIFTGTDIFSAFETAAKSIALTAKSQHPVLDDNNDGVFDESDGILAENTFIGNGMQINNDAPVLGNISVLTQQNSNNAALIKIDKVSDTDGIARVWAAIKPPGFNQGDSDNTVQGLPSAELIPKDDGTYEAVYENFNFSGTYEISIYARDRKGNTSVSEIFMYDADDPLQSKAVIIAGGAETEDLLTAIQKNAELAYKTLNFQGYSNEDIILLSPEEFLDEVDLPLTLANLELSLGTGLGNNVKNLVLYMVGIGEDNGFRLNNTEVLLLSDLDMWLDNLQDNIPGEVTVICDSFLSSSFIQQLTAPGDKLRILISSTSGIQPASFASNGDISFSRYFWNRIINGSDLYTSFIYAKNAIEIAGQGQIPQLDDNGNGTGNEQTDGTLAQGILLGAGIYLTGNAPIAQEFIADQTLNGETSAKISVENISTTGKIEKVWAVINPPSSFNLLKDSNTDLPIIELNEVQGEYQGFYNDFNYYGKYNVTIYAQDSKGNISTPMSSIIFQNQGPDVYEQDDNETQAGIITLGLSDVEKDSGIQRHNFHKPGDEDWVKFYAFPGVLYEIKTTNPGTLCNTIITLYDRDKPKIKNENKQNQTGELLSWTCETGGIYYLKITHANPDVFGADTGYDLLIYRPIGPVAGFISGNVTDAATGQPITGAIITSSANASALSLPGGNFLMIQEPGTSISVTVNVQGYEPYSTMMTLEQGGISLLDFSLTPIVRPEPVEPDTIPETSIISPESDITIDPGQSLDFRADYTSGNAPHTFAWDFDQAAEDSNELNPGQILFDTPGVYEITFTVTDADGDTDTASRTITVKEKATDNKPPEPEEPDVSPEPGISDSKPLSSIISPLADTEISAGESVDFDAEVSGGNEPLAYSWDFNGAAENVQAKTPGSIVFNIPGEYTITLTITDADGDTDSKTINIKVNEEAVEPGIIPSENEQPDTDPDIVPLTLPQGPESENVGGFGCFITAIDSN